MALSKAAKKARNSGSTKTHNENLSAISGKIEQLVLLSKEREQEGSGTKAE